METKILLYYVPLDFEYSIICSGYTSGEDCYSLYDCIKIFSSPSGEYVTLTPFIPGERIKIDIKIKKERMLLIEPVYLDEDKMPSIYNRYKNLFL